MQIIQLGEIVFFCQQMFLRRLGSLLFFSWPAVFENSKKLFPSGDQGQQQQQQKKLQKGGE